MKNILLALISSLLILLVFSSCDKDCVKSTGINGEWIWIKSKGGIGGWTLTPASEGITKKLIIDNFFFKEFENDQLIFESQYDLVIRDDSLYGSQKFIVFESGYEEGISISEYELVIAETMWFDGFTHYYERK